MGAEPADGILAHEAVIRGACFLGVLAVMMLWETLAARRRRDHSRFARWPGNLGIVVLDTLLLRLLFPTAAVGLARDAVAGGVTPPGMTS